MGRHARDSQHREATRLGSLTPTPDFFWESWARFQALRSVGRAMLAVALVVVLGVAGYRIAGWSLSDSIYMVAITISTVGFTEVRPLSTNWLRLHTILLILFGYVAVGYTLATLVAVITSEELKQYLGKKRVKRQIEELKQHVIVVGLGRMGTQLCTELQTAGVPFAIIDRDPLKMAEIERRQWLGIQGDATLESTLQSAGLAQARALVTTVPDDAFNVFIALTARDLNPSVLILTRAEDPSTLRKLQRAGADHVVQPTAIGAQRIATLLTNPTAVQFTELVTQKGTLEIEMDEIEVQAGGPFAKLSLRELDIGRRTGVVVIAVKHPDGRVEFPPSGTEPFQAGDRIVLLARRGNLADFHAQYNDLA